MNQDERAPKRKQLSGPTQRDVAKLANVSQAAVSRVMANNGYVAYDVRRRIEQAADQLGYRPDQLARGLITGQSNIIAVVMADFANPFYPTVLDALTAAIQDQGRQILLFNAGHDQTVDDLIPSVLQYKVAGIVVTTAVLSSNAAEMCLASGVPVVLMNRYSSTGTTNIVSCDNHVGGKQAAETLIAAGCKNLAYIGGRQDSSTNADRRRGFLEVANVSCLNDIPVLERAFHYNWGAQAVHQLMASRPDIDGIFCGDDAVAFGVLDQLRFTLGKRVPEDVSVVGFDDVPSAAWSAYNLTTIRQPLHLLVQKTIALMDSESKADPAVHFIPGELILRGTVRSR
ncbi:MAG TPA: LacI family DNA-binding transcriptional regulator [Shinella sp.]|uniref:LacI family DNA-binding transcriptional regulator n=1 Tax=Shinella sp. TaxID=1870904 RepID=UPI002E10D78E|nr:LacI family DNA-binding transcriptional regulator [Shinella sp.]